MTVNGHNLSRVNTTRRDAKTERLCAELTPRLATMPDEMLHALAIVGLTEFYRRRADVDNQGRMNA